MKKLNSSLKLRILIIVCLAFASFITIAAISEKSFFAQTYQTLTSQFSRSPNATSAPMMVQSGTCNPFGFSYVKGFAPEPATQDRPISVVSGDFNKDGKMDLVAANLFANTISVLIGDGEGGFSLPTNIPVVADGRGVPNALAMGDFNSDGNLDLAIAVLYGPGRLFIMSGDGTGNFIFTAAYNAGLNTNAVAVGDFNADGKLDAAVTNNGEGGSLGDVSVFLNDGVGNFSAATNFNAGTYPTALVTGDFTGDGKNDLAVANSGTNNVSILAGNGAGSFAAATNYNVGASPRGIAAGYFNGDTRFDLAVTNGADDTVSILLANGSGGFNAAANYAAGAGPTGIVIADFNGDSKADLAVSDSSANQAAILLNDGFGLFGAPSALSAGGQPLSLAVGDFNADAKADLAVANSASNNISILLGNGNGTFRGTTFLLSNPQAVTMSDLNLDTKLDLAVVSFNSDKVTVFLANGTGGYNVPSEFTPHIKPTAIDVEDFNKDGKPDLIIANNGSADVSLLLGDGTGNFAAPLNFPTDTHTFAVLALDVNKDGKPDVVTANEGTNNVAVLLGDGIGGFSAATIFAVGTQPKDLSAADVNSDGNLDLVVANSNSTFLSILLGNGAGSFSAGANIDLTGTNKARTVKIGDLNNDNKLDLIVGLVGQAKIAVLLGSGPSTFAAPITYDVGPDPTSIAVADYDGDAKYDIATANFGQRTISILRGNGDGTFAAQKVFDTGFSPISLVSGDLNSDSREDIAVVNSGSNSLSLMLNTCANTPPKITPVPAITRLQGSQPAISTLATVSDVESNAGTLQVTALAPAGISVTEISNVSGSILAKIAADCTATLGAKTVVLTVSDGTLSTQANLTVNVTANTAPSLGNYLNSEALLNNTRAIIPQAAPVDNGSIASITVSAAAGFTGTFSVAPSSGTITVNNPAPLGTYSLTVTATDNCGATTTKDFQLSVVAQPTITSIDPTTIQAQSGDFTLIVNGSGFTANSKIRWNGAERTTTFVSATKLTAAIPAADINLPDASSAAITVFDPAAGGITSGSTSLTITAPNPVPTTTSLNPATILAGDAGFTLTINGTNFIPNSVVKFNGVDRAKTYISATQLSISVSAADITNSGTAAIIVVNPAPGGGTSNTQNLAINNPAPGAIALSPNAILVGSAATLVTVTGTGFRPDSVVKINSVDRPTNYLSPTQVTTTLSLADLASAGTILITVNTPPPGGGLSPAATFTINNPAPSITSLNPASALAGGTAFTLNITGTGFVAGSTVKFNGTDRSTTFVSATQLSINVTDSDIANPGTINLTVSNATPGGGTSNTQSLPINNPVPVLNSLSQTSAQVGTADTAITLTGNRFRSNSVVRLNNIDRATTFTSSSQLGVTLTAADLANAGTLSILVFTPTPGGGTSSALTFTVGNPLPALTSIIPATVLTGDPAFMLTINGSGFVNASVVRWNGTDRATTFVNGNQLTINVAATDIANAGTAKITVVNPAPAGGTSNELSLAINNPAPTTSTLSQTIVTAGIGASSLTINGTGFRPNSVARVNGQDRVTTFVSGTQLTVALLAADVANAGTLNLSVFTPTPGGGASSALTLTVNNPAPTLSSLSPNSAFKGDPAFTLTITGTNFVNGSIVRWNGLDRVTTFISSTQLTAAIPESDLASDGIANVTVFNPMPGGGTTSAVTFTINPLTGYEADVNPRPNGGNDGKVTITDWVQVGRFAAGLDTVQNSSEFQRVDCAPIATNGDGRIGIADWVQAGRFAVGLDPVAPASGPSRPATLQEIFGSVASFESAQPELNRIIRARDAEFKRGELNALPIEIEALGNESGVSFSLNFDPRVMSFARAEMPEGWAVNVNEAQANQGHIGFMMTAEAGRTVANGKQILAKIYFAPTGGFDATTTKVSFDDQIFTREIADVRASTLPRASYEAATINITGRAIANVRAASYVGGELASDSIVSAFGADLATATLIAASVPLPTNLAGSTVKIKDSQGVARDAQLFFVSAAQVNYLIPADTAAGTATVTITNSNGVVSRGLLNVTSVAPSLFTADATGIGVAAAQVVHVSANNSQRWENVARYDQPTNKMIAVPIEFGTQNNNVYLVLYGTGFKQRSDLSNVQLRVGSVVVPIAYVGSQGGYAGVDQINARLPRTLSGRGAVNIELLVDGKTANTVTVTIK